MKIVKGILIGLVSIIALLLLIALFVKKEYHVVREITINKPRQEVFDYVKYLKNQENFSNWATLDPNMKKEYKGTDGTVGCIATWDSNVKDVGKWEQEIKKITEGERMDVELRIKEPFESTEQGYFSTETVNGDQTKVTWGFNGEIEYPMNLSFLVMDMDKMIGKDLEIGLSNLKNLLEK